MSKRNLAELMKARRPVEEVVGKLVSEEVTESVNAGLQLAQRAGEYGLNLRQYLDLVVAPTNDNHVELSGYQQALAHLNLPVRNDLKNGVVLQAANDTFQTYPGTRALFPEVIDDIVKWDYRQDQVVKTAPLLATSRQISGVELLSTVVNDKAADHQFHSPVSEAANVPVRSIRTSQQSVQIWKHGSGIEWTYEFERRASLNLMTPYVNRIDRETEISKVNTITSLLINGDSLHGAAGSVNQSTYDNTATNGTLSLKALLTWFVKRAEAGVPIDTVVGNWDALIQWMFLFNMPTIGSGGITVEESLKKAGYSISTELPLLGNSVKFVISPSMPANQLMGYARGDTVEELVEAGSNISEVERIIKNQTVQLVRTQNTGYRLVFGDTRQILNFGA